MEDWKREHPDIPEPQIKRSSGEIEVQLQTNGVFVNLYFKSEKDVQQFIDSYSKSFYVDGFFEGAYREKD